MALTRLIHTPQGFLRSMQMSRSTLFAFVEGKQHDPFVFGMLCSSVCSPRNVTYQICKANELLGSSGGKTALLTFHEYLRRRKALTTVLGGKTTHAIFFIDKDIDDILRCQRKCCHLVYTRYYDIQNDIFLNGRILEAVAASASLDPRTLTPFFANGRSWCRIAAERWKDWVILCIIATLRCINHQCNYRVLSKVQCKSTGVPDSIKVNQMKLSLMAKCGFDAVTFERIYLSIKRKVTKIYNSGEQDRIFKGKWYPAILDEDVFRQFGNNCYNKKGFVTRITSALALTLRAEDAWAQTYRLAIEHVLDN